MEYVLVDTEQKLEDLLKTLSYCKGNHYLALDTETNGLRPYHGDQIIGFSVYEPDNQVGYYVPYRHEVGYNVPDEWWLILKDWLILNHRKFILFNAKFDMHFLAQDGFGTPGYAEDVMIAARLLNENEYLSNMGQVKGAYQLKRLAQKYLGSWAGHDEKELYRVAKEQGIDAKGQMAKLPAELIAPYAITDTYITWELRQFYAEYLERWSQWELYEERCNFQLNCLFRMERNGITLDVEETKRQIEGLKPKIAAERKAFEDKAYELGIGNWGTEKKPEKFNPGSTQQLQAFFARLGYNINSTNKETLEKLTNCEWVDRILEYKPLTKAASTYFVPYLELVAPDGKIHGNFNTMGTVTGRLSSDEPNLQQIPREGGKYEVKQVFVASPGYVLVQMDYKQLELRLATHFAKEETMRRMINNGEDMHTYTANSLGVNRYRGKTLNFSMLYGMGAEKGAVKLKTTEKEAGENIRGWHELFPAFKRALYNTMAIAEMWREPDGSQPGGYQYVRLANNRIRHFNEYLLFPQKDKDGRVIPPPYFAAWNFVVQGTAGIVTDRGIAGACKEFDNYYMRPLIQVHDSFVFEARVEDAEYIIRMVKWHMENQPGFDPKLEVDVAVGHDWGSVCSYEVALNIGKFILAGR